ncbi:MAG: DeoR/GlpR family DNA-binding transcription regulator [Fusobacterium perfoetens]|uniref:DeoR/GlpR family DNA-binding transcription regulator n=1 Tax=Fusobacterium perfoetens TaxID=852 RepID=UPI0023F0B0A3|nr:DeoR/GlpR family DNA-binding transcription regulator [Fusobacterium perfoetens]MCI6152221.1 DeoR/GlpR family DNA-binding transcription regulator [Fusobacterium perfoetens]MDY3237710.1 DeoR/GlpR family DNA-binding transcription regulator [Fusobacterium perfoetens]
MFVEERHQLIISTLEKEGKIKVKDLSDRFNLTEDAIRKDLAILEKKGLLKRVYGGAVKTRNEFLFLNLEDRKKILTKEKQKIAEKAFSMIKENSTIFLDISTINIEICKMIIEAKLKVIIITNMIEILLKFLEADTDVEVIFIGGKLDNKNKEGFVGSYSIEQIKNFKYDIAFLGATGINMEEGTISTYFLDDAICKKEIIRNSKKKYVLIESQKLNIDGRVNFTTIKEIDSIITEKTKN